MKQQTKTYVFTDFQYSQDKLSNSKLQVKYSQNISNENGISCFSGTTNALQLFFGQTDFSAFSQANATTLSKIIYFYIYKSDSAPKFRRIFAVTSTYELFELNVDTKQLVNLNLKFSAMPKFYVSDNILYIWCDGNKVYHISGKGNVSSSNISFNIGSVAMFNGRFYFNTLEHEHTIFVGAYSSFSDLYDPEAHFAELKLKQSDGKVMDILCFNSGIYVFQEYKISKLTISNTSKNIFPDTTLCSPILPNSIQIMADNVVFATPDGLYTYSGSSLSKKFEELKLLGSLKSVHSMCVGSVYTLAFDAEINSGDAQGKSSHLIKFDMASGHYDIYLLDKIHHAFTVNYDENRVEMLTFERDAGYEVCYFDGSVQSNEEKVVRFVPTYFSDLKPKYLNSISVEGSGEFELKVKSEFTKTAHHVKGRQRICNLGILGSIFEIEISSKQNFEVSLISLEITETET